MPGTKKPLFKTGRNRLRGNRRFVGFKTSRYPLQNRLAILCVCHNLKTMAHKRKPTAHQKQVRFLMILLGAIMIIAVVGMILLLNRPVGGYGHH